MKHINIAIALRALDYAAGAGTLGYGAVTAQPLFIGFGVAGLVLAHLNLSDRISRRLRKYFSRKSTVKPAPLPGPEFPEASEEPHAVSRSDYAGMHLQVGPSLTSHSRHSVLKSAAHLDHLSDNLR